ncbi:MAG: DNA-3-methyladenine glycosylase [Ignavibacteriales bacterium]
MTKLDKSFYLNSALEVAPLLIGKLLVRKLPNGQIVKFRITETEIYYGEEDSACHARVGKTKRTWILYEEGGFSYVYLCYGIHYLLNVVTGNKDHPEAVLIRGIEGYNGPAKLTKKLEIDYKLNGIDLTKSKELWIEDDGYQASYVRDKRVGIEYASEPYRSIKWRFIMK